MVGKDPEEEHFVKVILAEFYFVSTRKKRKGREPKLLMGVVVAVVTIALDALIEEVFGLTEVVALTEVFAAGLLEVAWDDVALEVVEACRSTG